MKYQFNSKEHLHTLEGKPLTGTSTVMSVIAKPLTWWAAGLTCEHLGWMNGKKKIAGKYITTSNEKRFEKAGPVLERIKAMDVPAYVALLDNAYKAHSVSLKDSAEGGVDLHAECERFVKNTMENRMAVYDEKIRPFIEWTNKNVEHFLWSEMHCYSEKHWVGGISDAGAKLKDGNVAIIDFKSSNDAYASHFWQIAGYDIEITENGGYDANGNRMFTLDAPITQHIVIPFGSPDGLPVVSREIESGKRAFLAALTIYRELNKLESQ